MSKNFRFLAAAVTALSLIATSGAALAAPKDRPEKDKQQQKGQGKAKQRKNKSGKEMLGGKLKQNGRHKLEQHDKFDVEADVQGGKVAGVKVKHSEKGDVAVTKYKSDKKVASVPRGSGIYLAQYGYVTTVWIGYAFIDDYGYECIYWFPVEDCVDGDYGAVDYYDYGYGYGY